MLTNIFPFIQPHDCHILSAHHSSYTHTYRNGWGQIFDFLIHGSFHCHPYSFLLLFWFIFWIRFLCQFILLFAVHLASLSAFRFLASCFQTMVASTTAASFAIIVLMLFGGYVIPLCKATQGFHLM